MFNVASYYLNLLMVNLFNLAEDLCVEVLIPIYWDLWQRLLLVGNCALIFFSPMLYQIQRCIHQLMRYMRYQPGKALLNGVHWTYYGLVILYQHNAYKVILRAIQYHLLFSLTMACLDWMWMVGSQAVKAGLQFLKQEELQISDSSSVMVNYAVCTSMFHVNEVTLNQHVPQPNSSIFQKFSSSLKWTYQIQRCIHQLMRYMRYQPGKALLNGVHWTYYGLVILYQHNAYKVILRAIQYHLLFSLTMACLDWMWMVGSQAVKTGLQFLKQEELQISDSSSVMVNYAVWTSMFHVNEVTLNQHVPQPNSSIFQKFSSSLNFMSVYTKIKEGIRYCCFGTSSGQITRIQGNHEENSGLSLSSEDIIHQIKSTFVTFFLFYIYNTFLFVQVIK